MSAHYSLFYPFSLFVFDGENSYRPIVANIILTCRAPLNILRAETAALEKLVVGATIIIPADDSNETRALLLLEQEELIAQTQLTA